MGPREMDHRVQRLVQLRHQPDYWYAILWRSSTQQSTDTCAVEWLARRTISMILSHDMVELLTQLRVRRVATTKLNRTS